MIVVCDSSPLINLARIGALALLRQLFDEIWIPKAVWTEVVERGRGRPGAVEVANAQWIHRRAVHDRHLADALQMDLGPGESEALVLAIEMKADLLIVDDYFARAFSQAMKVRYVGLLGVLLLAKKRGLITEASPYLHLLRHRAGFWMSDALYEQILLDAGEINDSPMPNT